MFTQTVVAIAILPHMFGPEGLHKRIACILISQQTVSYSNLTV